MQVQLPSFASPGVRLLALSGLALLSACGSDSDPTPAGSADFLVTDAPIDDLAAFQARLLVLQLNRADGSSTPNLLASPVQLEFLGLQGISAWLASSPVAAGTYTGLTATFDPNSTSAVALDGTPVAVQSVSTTLQTVFPVPVEVQDAGYVRFETDLDVASSLLGEVSSGSIQFSASGSSSSSDGSFEAPIDEIQGVVTSVDAGASTLRLNAFADGDLAIPLGDVEVLVNGSTALVGDNDVPFADAPSFFAFLVPGQSLLEVHGNLGSNGSVVASRIEVEDQIGGLGGGDTLVRIEGLVQNLNPAGSFDLLIQEIEKGQSVASGVLAQLGNPSSIGVSFDGSTQFFFDDDVPTTSGSLANGQEIDARFAAFQSEPFAAFEIEIDLTPTVGIPAVWSAQDASSTPAISVDPRWTAAFGADQPLRSTDVELFLDAPGTPSLTPSDLSHGQALRLSQLEASGPRAAQARVLPGRLDQAQIVAFDAITNELFVVGGEVTQPFAGAEPFGPVRVDLDTLPVPVGPDQLERGAFVNVIGLSGKHPGELRAFALELAP